MVDPTSDSDSELNSIRFLRFALAILASIVCLAALNATHSCFFGEELKIVFGLRALVIAGASGYGAYYCLSSVPSDFERSHRLRMEFHRWLRIMRNWIWRVKTTTNSFCHLIRQPISRRLSRKLRAPSQEGTSPAQTESATQHSPDAQSQVDEPTDTMSKND